MCARSFSASDHDRPGIFSRNKIIAVELSSGSSSNLVGMTERGDTRHLGGVGGSVTSIVNSGSHAIITAESGSRVLFNYKTESFRGI